MPAARLVFTFAVLAATVGTAGAQVAGPSPAAAGFEPSPLYAGMFVDGAVIRLRGTRGELREGRLRTRAVRLGCRIERVRSGVDAVLADLVCDRDSARLAGTFGATAKGLYKVYRGPDSAAPEPLASVVEQSLLVMPATPRVGRVVTGDKDEGGETKTTRRRGGYCRSIVGWPGDLYYDRFCFARGRIFEYEADDQSAFPVVLRLRRVR